MSVMRRFLSIFSFLLFVAHIFVASANACSLAGCVNDGVELRPTFTVLVTHSDKPLSGVSVEISGNGRQVSFTTGVEGKITISSLQPGTYWINVQYLGIGAAYQCFHIPVNPTKKAKRKLSYEWGDDAPATQRIAGTVVDVQPGKGGTPLENLIHAVPVPIVGSKVKLQDPTDGNVYTTSSDKNGYFALDGVPEGTYVLRIEGGDADGRAYGATDELIELSSHAKNSFLMFTRRDGGAGSCGGGTYMELKGPPSK